MRMMRESRIDAKMRGIDAGSAAASGASSRVPGSGAASSKITERDRRGVAGWRDGIGVAQTGCQWRQETGVVLSSESAGERSGGCDCGGGVMMREQLLLMLRMLLMLVLRLLLLLMKMMIGG